MVFSVCVCVCGREWSIELNPVWFLWLLCQGCISSDVYLRNPSIFSHVQLCIFTQRRRMTAGCSCFHRCRNTCCFSTWKDRAEISFLLSSCLSCTLLAGQGCMWCHQYFHSVLWVIPATSLHHIFLPHDRIVLCAAGALWLTTTSSSFCSSTTASCWGSSWSGFAFKNTFFLVRFFFLLCSFCALCFALQYLCYSKPEVY